jgi:hypothetical protein
MRKLASKGAPKHARIRVLGHSGWSGIYADSLVSLTTAVNRKIDAPLGQNLNTQWTWTDDFVNEAMAIHKERAELQRRSEALDAMTRENVVRLADRGLTTRDIGTLLGISAARVAQLRAPGFAFGDPDDTDSPVEVIVVHTDKGPLTLHGRGTHPPELEYDGRPYRAIGCARGANGGPTKYSYVPVE